MTRMDPTGRLGRMGLIRLLMKLLAPPPRARRDPAPTYLHRPEPAQAEAFRPQGVLDDASRQAGQHSIKGRCWVIDGDTIVINKTHIRLSGIDAPEMDQPYGKNAKRN